jgi:hypothetical protein
MMVGADDSALQQRPERFHVVCMHHTAHLLAFAMIHGLVRTAAARALRRGAEQRRARRMWAGRPPQMTPTRLQWQAPIRRRRERGAPVQASATSEKVKTPARPA